MICAQVTNRKTKHISFLLCVDGSVNYINGILCYVLDIMTHKGIRGRIYDFTIVDIVFSTCNCSKCKHKCNYVVK